MKSIKIAGQSFLIKDYYCAQDGDEYLAKTDGKLWLYVNLTDLCPCSCPFCVNPCKKSGENPFKLSCFQDALDRIRDYICGVSFTGGEPMLHPQLLDKVIEVTHDTLGSEVEIDMVTSGLNFEKVLSLKTNHYLYSIHISRHRTDDGQNRQLMGIRTPSLKELEAILKEMQDPGKVVFNCILHKDGIHSVDGMAEYLEMAAQTGVRNTSFISLIPANDYCREQFVHPASLHPEKDERFRIWNRFHDHDFCSCSSGDYKAASGWVRFYYRAPGRAAVPYARQLVYTADNRLLAGFGGPSIDLNPA